MNDGTSFKELHYGYGRSILMRNIIRFFVLLFALVLLQGCWGDHSWNQKITIVVETPDGIRTGSSITHIEWKKNHFFKDGGPWWIKVVGEAAFVELGDGRYLFAPIGTGEHARLAKNLVLADKSLSDFNSFDGIYELAKPTIIPSELYPELVTFGDIDDLNSIMSVNSSNFEEIFGNGYNLKEIIIEITTDKPAFGSISKILPCLDQGISCVPFNENLKPDNPIRDITNSRFRRKK